MALFDHILPAATEPREAPHRAHIMDKTGGGGQQHARAWVTGEKAGRGNKQRGNKSLLPPQPSNLILILWAKLEQARN